jgi:predicted RNA binding protein YcfA (HicA-like mRNA interferase family)
MPKRLSTRPIERILRHHGFQFVRQTGSHIHYKGIVEGRTRLVTLIANQKDYHPKTLKSIIAQSGLPDEIFD